MTGSVIHLHGDQHFEAHSLLPWYVTGRLEAAERAQVEAHLNGCPECQAELTIERGLQARIAGLRMDVEQDWAKLRARLERDPPGRSRHRYGSSMMRFTTCETSSRKRAPRPNSFDS